MYKISNTSLKRQEKELFAFAEEKQSSLSGLGSNLSLLIKKKKSTSRWKTKNYQYLFTCTIYFIARYDLLALKIDAYGIMFVL